jgi:hypothetical protein
LRAHGIDNRVIVTEQVVARDVAAKIDIAKKAKAGGSRGAVINFRDRFDLIF